MRTDLDRFLRLCREGQHAHSQPRERAARALAQAIVIAWPELDACERLGVIDYTYEVARGAGAAARAAGVWNGR